MLHKIPWVREMRADVVEPVRGEFFKAVTEALAMSARD